MRIAISPDENPGDSGSVAADGTTERSVNLLVASALLAALKRCGQDAWFDPSITFDERVAQANGDGTHLLVACAHDVSTPGVRGTCFVFCPGGEEFGKQAAAADAVYASLAVLPGWPARRPNVVENVFECCAFNGDTVYVEYLCMSPDDEPLWSAPNYAMRAAEATCRALSGVYGFQYVPLGAVVLSTPPPIWTPVPTDAASHHWGPYVVGADQVVELPRPLYAPVYLPGQGHWFRNIAIVGVPQMGQYALWPLANRVKGAWYVMDISGGPSGNPPLGWLPVEDSWWIDDSAIDDSGGGGTDPPSVAKTLGGQWWAI